VGRSLSWTEFQRVAHKAEEPFWLRHVERRLSIPVSFVLVRLLPAVTPSAVSATGAVLGLLGMAALALGSFPWLVAGIALIQAWKVLDGVDGEVARVLAKSSLRGAYLDSALDSILVPLVFMAVAARLAGEGLLLDAALAAAVGSAFYATKVALLQRAQNVLRSGRKPRFSQTLKGDMRVLESQGSLAVAAGAAVMRAYAVATTNYVVVNAASLTLLLHELGIGPLPWVRAWLALSSVVLLAPFGALVGTYVAMDSLVEDAPAPASGQPSEGSDAAS
jgi:phosphatidylglycerophosphate synthase